MDLKTEMYGLSPTFVLIVLLSVSLIFGGVSRAYTQNARHMYELVVTNNASEVTTVLQVFAPNEKEARENVAANGWTIHSIRQVTFRTANPFELETPDPVSVPDNILRPRQPVEQSRDNLTDEQLINSILGAPIQVFTVTFDSNGGSPVPPVIVEPNRPLGERMPSDPSKSGNTFSGWFNSARGTPFNRDTPVVASATVVARWSPAPAEPKLAAPLIPDEDLLALTPDYGNLNLKYIVYFDLGNIDHKMTDVDKAVFNSLDKNMSYYLAGHTDNVSVSPDAPYKDNFELSYKRSQSVKDILADYGINPANITTVGYGSLYTAVKNTSSPEGTVQNRRVEIYEIRKTD